jgi:hypothetical protein
MKIRASALGQIMTNGRGTNKMGATALSALREMWIQQRYGRSKQINTADIAKGIAVEEKSIALLSLVDGELYQKNTERKSNDCTTGECDIYTGDKVIDVKSSFDIYTFFNGQPPITKTGKLTPYGWQLTAYGWLWEVEDLQLSYCLSNTPEDIVEGLIYREALRLPGGDSNPLYVKVEEEVRRNHTFDNIPDHERVRSFEFKVDPNNFKLIEDRHKECEEIVKRWDQDGLD